MTSLISAVSFLFSCGIFSPVTQAPAISNTQCPTLLLPRVVATRLGTSRRCSIGALNHTGVANTSPLKNAGPLWTAQLYDYTGSGVTSISSSAAVTNGNVYVAAAASSLFNQCRHGRAQWNCTTTNAANPFYSSPAVAGGLVYIGNNDYNLTCFDATTGATKWTYQTGGAIWSSPAVVNGRVYVGTTDLYVYCLNASTGAFLWKNETDSNIYCSPAVVNGRVYIGTNGGSIYCLDANTGYVIWNNQTTYPIQDSSPAVANGYVYVGDEQMYPVLLGRCIALMPRRGG